MVWAARRIERQPKNESRGGEGRPPPPHRSFTRPIFRVLFDSRLLARQAACLCIDRFHCHATKKINWKTSGGRSQENECYKRVIFKQFVQVSGLCGPPVLSYLPKRFTHLCRALYGDTILVYRFGAQIWPPEINKNIWSSLFL